MMLWDQWGFWGGMFQGSDWWTLFEWQVGPHREGLGYLVIKLTAIASQWDTKAEAYVIGCLFLASCLVALAIKWRLSGRWSMFDVCIPLIVLTIGNVEAYAGTTNPAHGPVPLLLIFIKEARTRRTLDEARWYAEGKQRWRIVTCRKKTSGLAIERLVTSSIPTRPAARSSRSSSI
jgi:hypothetical protein